ncbi:MAG: hypothetical protein OCC46_12800 [Pseudodesulfovibrio sp.]
MNASHLQHFIREKRKECMLGFVPFCLYRHTTDDCIHGLINIGERPDSTGGGFLVLSCIMDIPRGPMQKELVRDVFRRMAFDRLGLSGLVTVMRTDVVFQQSTHMMMEELTFSFSQLAGKQKTILRKSILPELTRCGFSIGDVEWFEEPRGSEQGLLHTISSLTIKKLFG